MKRSFSTSHLSCGSGGLARTFDATQSVGCASVYPCLELSPVILVIRSSPLVCPSMARCIHDSHFLLAEPAACKTSPAVGSVNGRATPFVYRAGDHRSHSWMGLGAGFLNILRSNGAELPLCRRAISHSAGKGKRRRRREPACAGRTSSIAIAVDRPRPARLNKGQSNC